MIYRHAVMSSLQRYRKPGGFIQLVSLLETFGPSKRVKFLEMIEAESAAWATALREKMLTIDRVGEWPEEALLKILKSMPLKSQAYALAGFSKDVKDRVWRGISVADQRRITEIYGENNPKAEEINAIVTKFVETARRLILERELDVERIDASLIVAENIELKLDGGGAAAVAAGAGGDAELRAALKDARRENQTLRDELAKVQAKLDQIRKFAA